MGYVLLEKGPASVQLYFRDEVGRTWDSLRVDSGGFFRWQVGDSLSNQVRISVHAPQHVWKEVSVRLRSGRENRVDIYLERLKPGLRLPLFYVYFDKGSAKLLPESYPQLLELARFLQEHPRVRIELAGHTDGTSLPESEIQLSRERALAVRDYLVAQGVAKDRFSIVGYGKARPIADNATPEGQRRNRRVEFRILAW
jgi:outer membrane protein OmpA-like peptidoglycan-associated protein